MSRIERRRVDRWVSRAHRTGMMQNGVALLLVAFGVGIEARAEPQALPPQHPSPEALVGFWSVDGESMNGDPRFKATMDSAQGRAGVAYAQGVLLEFTPDHRVRSHLGRVEERAATITPGEGGVLRIEPEGTSPWMVEQVSNDAFIQRFPDVEFEILWARSWEPFVGAWRVAMGALEGEQWFASLNEQQREALQEEIESLRLAVDDRGVVVGHWAGQDRRGTLSLESTMPPAAAVVEDEASRGAAHFVRRERGASLYLGDRTWPLERERPPSEVAIGAWKVDIDRAMTMEWLRQSVPEGKTLEEFVRESFKLGTVIPVTATTWNNQPFAVVDERGDQFAADANGRTVFWVRVVDEDHLVQFAGGGREFPLKRVKPEGE